MMGDHMSQKVLFERGGKPHVMRSAEISDCEQYRWWLRRSWDGSGRVVCFVMLNPSTADAMVDDPTIRRCISFARSWGYSVLSVRNLFAFRATDPKDLKKAGYPTGGERGDGELAVAKTAHTVVCAWGTKAPSWRVNQALQILSGRELFCLGKTKAGDPRHPLYVPADQELVQFK